MKIKIPDEDKPLPMDRFAGPSRLPKPLRDPRARFNARLKKERERKANR